MALAPGSQPIERPAPFPRDRALDRERLFSLFFLAIFFFLVFQLLRVLAPFLSALLCAAMLALVAHPLQGRLARRIGSENAAALVLTVLLTITFVIPVAILLWMLVREAAGLAPALNDWWGSLGHTDPAGSPVPVLDRAWRSLSDALAQVDLDVRSIALGAARDLGNRLTAASGTIVRQLFGVLFQIVVLLLGLFFFLRDGARLVRTVFDLVPMETESKMLVLQGLDRTLVAMLRGTMITAAAQSVLLGVGLAIFGSPVPVLLTCAAAILAIVPFVGTALIWIPVAVYLAATDHLSAAIGLSLWGLGVVGLIDNLLRPIMVGSHARLPAMLLFLGIVGGLQVYGLVGGLISPLLIACVLSFAHIYRERYLRAPSGAR